MLGRKLIAEFIGTFALCFAGVVAICAAAQRGADSGLVGVALAHGLTLAAFASAFGMISGGHFNPAVTLAMLLTKKISIGDTIGYWVSQFIGGAAAAAAAKSFLGDQFYNDGEGGVPKFLQASDATAVGMSNMQAIGIEAVLTFFLTVVIFGTAVHKKAPAVGGLFIGLVLAGCILAGGPFTGAALNPARYLGPSLVYDAQIAQAFVYFVGPCLGAVIAAAVYLFAMEPKSEQEAV